MGNIKTRILISYLIVVSILILVIGSIFTLHFVVVDRYRTIIDNIVLGNVFAEEVPEFIETYYLAVQAPNSTDRIKEYEESREHIKHSIRILDTTIINKDSLIAYRGLKNLVTNIIQSCDDGIQEAINGNKVKAAEYYDEGLNKKFFVIDNTAGLMMQELKYARKLQEDINVLHEWGLGVVIAVLIATIIFCIIYVFAFAHKLTSPIVRLSQLAEGITKGSLNHSVDDNLLYREDEIGSLSKSFNIMVGNLKNKISELEAANKDITKNRKYIEEKNSILERFNKAVVNREVKMIELKKEVKRLKKELEKYL